MSQKLVLMWIYEGLLMKSVIFYVKVGVDALKTVENKR